MNIHPVISAVVLVLVPDAVEACTGGGFDYPLVRLDNLYDVVLMDVGDAGAPYVDDEDVPLEVEASVTAMRLDCEGGWLDPVELYRGQIIDACKFMGTLKSISYHEREIQIAARGWDFQSF